METSAYPHLVKHYLKSLLLFSVDWQLLQMVHFPQIMYHKVCTPFFVFAITTPSFFFRITARGF